MSLRLRGALFKMLTVPQIEALRSSNPQLYEALKRLANASLGPNQGWSLDHQVTDGADFARVVTGALTAGKIDPTKAGSCQPSEYTYLLPTAEQTTGKGGPGTRSRTLQRGDPSEPKLPSF